MGLCRQTTSSARPETVLRSGPGSSRWRGGLRTRYAEAMVECCETSAAAPATRNRSERGGGGYDGR